MNYGEESDRTLQKVKRVFEELYPQNTGIVEYQKYIDQLKILDVITEHRGGTVVLFDRQKFEVIHITGRLGNNKLEDLLNAQYFFDSLYKEHKEYPLVATKWYNHVLNKLSQEEKQNIYVNYCGISVLYPKEKHILRLNISTMDLETGKEGNSSLALLIIDNITHLIKGKGYWFRASIKDKIFSYFSEDEQSHDEDIISSREMEILKYISEGLNTKKIAEKLQISPNTVDNHRRNMLARTGARDTTALIQLCRLNGIL